MLDPRPHRWLGDAQLDVAGLCRQQPRPRTVAFSDAGVGAFVTAGADHVGGFDLDQLLQHQMHGVADQIDSCLRESGYDVVNAEDGKGAVLMAWEAKPDLVLLDLGLPGLDGITVLDDLDTLPVLCSTPVVVLSGRDPSVAEPHVRQYGISAFLRKPVATDVLLATIAEALATGFR